MFRLFSRVPRGLDPIADIFKQHVESEGMKLVKEVAEAVEAKKEKDAGKAGAAVCGVGVQLPWRGWDSEWRPLILVCRAQTGAKSEPVAGCACKEVVCASSFPDFRLRAVLRRRLCLC